MTRLHPRYVEGLTPAVAAMLGCGAAWASSLTGRVRFVMLLTTLVIVIVYAERLLYGRPTVWWIVLSGALGAIVLATLARLSVIPSAPGSPLLAAGVLALTLIAVLAIPVSVDMRAVRDRVSDAGYVGALPGEEQRLLSDYLRAHQGTARYEVAAASATQVGSLIVKDARPIAVLTSYGARVFISVPKLKQLIARGEVRYAFLASNCGKHASTVERRLLGAGAVDSGPRDRRVPPGGSRPRRGAVAAPWSARVSVEDRSSLEAFALGARAAGKIALDTEFMGEGRYRTLLCLVQLAIPDGADGAERIEIVDPLAEDLDGAPLAAVLEDPAIQVVVHAGRQDVALMRRRFGTDVRNVFDTQVAAGFAGMGAQASYESLLAEILGVRVAKSASFTRWDTRPLSAEQRAYAREDVVHLLALAAELERRLQERGRLQWAYEECEPLERSSDERDPEAIFARLPRVGGLNASARPIARELVDWREQRAARQDRPVQSVLSDVALMEIAKRRPSSRGELERIRGLGAGGMRGRADELLEVVRRAQALPPDPSSQSSRPPGPRPEDAPLVSLAEALLRARAREARLAYELLASRADLQAIVAARRTSANDASADAEADVRTLRGWRRELVGEELLELLDGRVSLSIRGQRLQVTRP